MVLYSRPITFTPAVAQPQTRYLPANATLRQIRPPAPPAPSTTTTTQPGGLSGSGGELTDEMIAARAQMAVNRYPSAPFQNYTVQGGMWYGVSNVDGSTMYTRLNPATADTSPNPNYRYMVQGTGPATFSEGSAGWSKITPSARPEPPGAGATKAQLTAYSESLASWEREQLWRSVPDSANWTDISDWYGEARFDLPTQDRRQWEINQALLPTFPSAKAQAIESQYAAQQKVIVSSSGNLVPVSERYTYVDDSGMYLAQGERAADYRNVSTGTLFSAPAVLDMGAKAVAAAPAVIGAGLNRVQMQLATMRSPFDLTGRVDMGKATLPLASATFGAGVGAYGKIAGKGVGAGLGLSPDTMQKVRTTALGLPVISTVWSAGEYIGLDYLIGVKTAEYQKEYTALESQGLIVGGEFKGTEAQYTALDAKYQQLEHLQQLQNVTLDRTLGVNVAEARAGTAFTGGVYEGGAGITEWADTHLIKPAGETIGNLPPVAFGAVAGGMMLAGVSPTVLPHTASFVKGVATGVAAVPSFVGMAVVGGEGLLRYPQAIPGAALLGGYIQAKGMYEGISTRPVEFAGEMYGTALALGAVGRAGYALSPVKYTSAAFRARGMPTATYRGLYAESPIMGLKKLIGTRAEWVGTRNLGGLTSYEGRPWYRPTPSRGVPTHLVDYISEGYVDFPGTVVKVPLVEERLIRVGRPGELAAFREELNLIDTMHGFKPSTIKDPVAEFQRIPGVSRDAAAEFLATLRDEFPTHRVGGSLAQSIQSRFSRAPADVDLYLPREQIAPFKEYVMRWNRRYGTSVKVDIHEYPQPGSYIGRYGVQTMKDITVEGTHFMHIGEQALRKSTSGMMLRDSREGWYVGPEAHRGKDIADMLGAVESELYRVRESPVGFLYRGKQARLTHAVDVLRGRMEPGALPTETIGGRFYDPSQAAATRYAQYTWDLTESPYVKFPGTRTYFDPTQYTGRVAATYAQFGVPAGTPWGIVMETGGKQARATIPEGTPTTNIRVLADIPIGRTDYPTTYRPARSSVRPLIAGYPSAVKVPRLPDFIPSYAPTIPSLKKTPTLGAFLTGKYPQPSVMGGRGTYPGMLVDNGKYPTPVVDLPGKYPELIGGGKTPSPDLFTPTKTPYPKTTRTTPTKYPGITRVEKTPYPSVRKVITEKYPGVKITTGGGKTAITTTTFGGEYGRTTTTSERQRITIPKTFPVPFTIPAPKKLVIFKEEETPRKKLRLHFDVRGSKWLIKNPIPRPEVVLGGEAGKQYKNELRIYDKQYSKKTYTVHAPFDIITDYKVTKGLRF